MRFETLAVHAGRRPETETGAVAPPIHLVDDLRARTRRAPRSAATPTSASRTRRRRSSRRRSPPLEGGAAALVFASGMAAGVAVLQALPRGAHVVLPDDAYYGYGGGRQRVLPARGA